MAMRATKKIAKRLKDPSLDPESKEILNALVNALDTREKIDMSRLFDLNYNDFELVLKLLVDWRLQQYRKPSGGLKQAIEETAPDNNYWH